MGAQELFGWAGLALILSAIPALPMLSRRGRRAERIGAATALVGLLLISAGFILRWSWYITTMNVVWYQAFPVTSLYESAVFFSACLAVVGFYGRRSGFPWAPVLWLTAGIVILAVNLSAVPVEPVLFLPSLKSGWLVAHVSLSFIAYALYAAAAIMSIPLLKGDAAADKAQTVRNLIRTATLIFTVGGLVFGAVWAHESWGRFWAWDPKETWAFITWSAYCLLLHFDLQGRLSARQLGVWSIVNFGVVLFTYFGVSLLFTGLHSYINASVMP